MALNKTLILISGYAQSGKDTYADAITAVLGDRQVSRFKFAHILRNALWGAFQSLHSPSDPWTEDPEQKIAMRPLMVELARFARAENKDVFVNATLRMIEHWMVGDNKVAIVSDLRYFNEYQRAKEWGEANGVRVLRVWVERDGIGPANEEEEWSINELNGKAHMDEVGRFATGQFDLIRLSAEVFATRYDLV